MKKSHALEVRGTLVRVVKIGGEDYVCLSDMAKLKSEDPQQTISNWMRNRMTLEYMGLWESLYNPDFNPLGFEGVPAHRPLDPGERQRVIINDGIPKPQHLRKLNEIALTDPSGESQAI